PDAARRRARLAHAALRPLLHERCCGQLDRGVERERRELLPLRLLDALRLLLGELAQTAHDLLGVAAEGESETATFHAIHSSDDAVARRPARRPRARGSAGVVPAAGRRRSILRARARISRRPTIRP